MKKSGLYLAFEFEYDKCLLENKANIASGIEKKIYHQFKTFESYGYEIEFYNPYINRKHSIERILRRLPFHYLYKWNYNLEKIKNFDFIYIRKMWFMDGDLILFLKAAKKINPSIKILLEIPTYPYDSEGKKMNMIPLKIKDKFWRKFLYKYVDRIVTYSDDNEIFNIRTIKTSNAIDFLSSKRSYTIKEFNKTYNFIACASLHYWHGYDRAIEGLYQYYLNNNCKNIKLYIVGEGEEFQNLRNMIYKYKLEKNVDMLGFKSGQELDNIYNKCVIGLDSMGRHRSGVRFNSSLKGKEYCAKGLFIVSGVETELDLDKNFKYYYRIPADDSPVDFEKIISSFEDSIENNSIEHMQEEIINYAKENFDFSVAMLPIKLYIENSNSKIEK